jgi:hypothetical protein
MRETFLLQRLIVLLNSEREIEIGVMPDSEPATEVEWFEIPVLPFNFRPFSKFLQFFDVR